MKRWMVYAGILASFLILFRNQAGGSDIAKMEPVEVLRITCDSSGVCLETDTGRCGYGKSLAKAVEDMANSADHEIFLETADYLLVDKTAETQIPELMKLLRPSCKICSESGEADLSAVAAFLKMHDPQITMKEYRIGQKQLPVLTVTEGRMHLDKP